MQTENDRIPSRTEALCWCTIIPGTIVGCSGDKMVSPQESIEGKEVFFAAQRL